MTIKTFDVHNGALNETKKTLYRMTAHELARMIQDMNAKDQVLAFRMLEKDRAIAMFEQLDADAQARLVRSLENPEVVQILEQLDPDDRTQLFEELPAKVTKRLLAEMRPESREMVSDLLGYPAESAGRVMTPNYLAVRGAITVEQALVAVRASSLQADEIDLILAISEERHYQGYIRLGQLVKAEALTSITELTQGQDVFVRVTDSQIDAARLLQTQDLPAVPVLDSEQRLVGVVTFDDVIDLLETDASEMMYWKAGVGDLAHRKDEVYSRRLTQGPIWYPVRVRILFLFVTLAGGLAVGSLIDQFEEVLAAVLVAAVFIPLVMDMGGNVGTQSTTIFARGLALGHINLKRFHRHLFREVGIGVTMGVALGIIGGTVAYFWQGVPNGIPQIGVAVGVSLSVVVSLATFLGFLLPWLMVKLGLDHAPGADPFITTIKDFTGLALYFSLVNWLIGVA